MKDRSKLATFAALVLLVVAIVSIEEGLPNLSHVSNTFLWILGGLLIWRLAGGSCCRASRCKTSEPPAA